MCERTDPKPSPDTQGIKTPPPLLAPGTSCPKPSPDTQGIKTPETLYEVPRFPKTKPRYSGD